MALDNMDSDCDDDEDADLMKKRQEIDSWLRFCAQKIDKIQKVWEKKIGHQSSINSDSEASSEDLDGNDNDNEMFNNLAQKF